MNFVAALLYPIAMLLSSGGNDDQAHGTPVQPTAAADTASDGSASLVWPDIPPQVLAPEFPGAASTFDAVQPGEGWQVRIEQRMQIRITPRGAAPPPRDMFIGIPDPDFDMHVSERKIGKCLSIAGIAGMQPDGGNRLLLYMRDSRLITAELERSCRARDFYSGFYLSKTTDGQLCVDRDSLLSRSGMNCKLTRIRQLVQQDR